MQDASCNWSSKAEMGGNQELDLNQADDVVEEIKKRLRVLETEAKVMVDEYSEMRILIDEASRELHRYHNWLANNKHASSEKPITATLQHKFCQVIKCMSRDTMSKSWNSGAYADAAASRRKEESGVGLVQLLQKDSKQCNIMTRESTVKMIE